MSAADAQFEQFLRMQMVGLFLSPVLYGISLALAAATIRALIRQRAQVPESLDGTVSPILTTGPGPRTRLALFLYVIFAVGCASAALGQDVQWMKKCEQQRLYGARWGANHPDQKPDTSFPDSPWSLEMELMAHVRTGGPALVLAVWAASTFLTWRCVVLAREIKSSFIRDALNALEYVLVATLLAAGILHFFDGSHIGSMPDEAFLVLLTPPITAVLALILTLLNALLHSPHYRISGLTRTLAYAAKFTVESGALIVTASTAYALLFFYDRSDGTEVVFRILLPHVCVISTLLIAQNMVRADVSVSWHTTSEPGHPLKPLLLQH